MRIKSDMSSADIQEFFNTYLGSACTSAVCKRLGIAALHQSAASITAEERSYYVDFSNTMISLARKEREREDRIFGSGKSDDSHDNVNGVGNSTTEEDL